MLEEQAVERGQGGVDPVGPDLGGVETVTDSEPIRLPVSEPLLEGASPLVGGAGGNGTSGAADGDLVVLEGDLHRPATLAGHRSRCLRSGRMRGVSPTAAWIGWT